jgi:basic membrane lipoprotein Med (substrate-binding protein (PBP1-ABC) superfamily)
MNPTARIVIYIARYRYKDLLNPATGARRAAENFIAQGADVIFSSGDGIDVGVSLAASERKVWFTTVYADIPRIRPMDTLLGSIVFNWDVVLFQGLDR